MNNDKLKILEMVKAGTVTPAEGFSLLEALQEPAAENASPAAGIGVRCLHIRVTSKQAKKVNVNIPLGLLKVATKFAAWGTKFIPEKARQEMQEKGVDITDIDFDELLLLIDQGLVTGKLVDIDVEDDKDGPVKVEIYIA